MLGALELRLAAVRSSVVSRELADGLRIRRDVLVVDVLDKGVVVRQVAADKAMPLHDNGRAVELVKKDAKFLL
eukprot:5048178-Pleurochrysis_carterae.AAC.1